ncbi:hypothetical protein BGZ99_008519 [Dissophora globulifera]|uniref:C2H2-type domain-containing protein n=1 Tax=Dissophora globulifera TaxID=979702 RepID=A0A9P6UPQ2_9FUNG|nr:hypothetical protein BGZ99_008519 [Dissophora globulifera]
MFLAPKLESDPRDFYVDDNSRDLAPSDAGAYMVDHPMGMDGAQRHAVGAKQPRDRMRLNRILNGSSSSSSEEMYQQQQQQQQPHPENSEQQYNNYSYPDNTQQQQQQQFQSFHPAVGTMPVSTFPSPMAVPVATLPTLATMSSSMSPSTSFSTMSQPNLIFDNVMHYQYNGGAPYQNQGYPFKHAGNAKSMDPSTFSADSNQGYSPQTQHYQHSPDPAGSPSVLSTFPQRMNSDGHNAPDSPPSSFYHGQHQAPSPYSIGSHSPTSNGSYPPAYVATGPGYSSLTPTPPATPHYGFSHTPDGRYAGTSMPVYGDYFTLQSQQSPAGARPGNRYLGSPSTPPTPTPSTRRKTPYQPRAARTNELGAAGAAPAPRRFQCHECDKAFPTKGELASHSRCHLKVPAFLCGICGRPFKRRTDYVRHVRNVHEEVGRYSCSQCGERFGRLDKLKRHDKRGCGADPEDDDK